MITSSLNSANDNSSHSNSPDAGSQFQSKQVACVVDLDNLLHRGFDKRSRSARPQGLLDIMGLSTALRESGVERGTICRHREFTAFAEQLWVKLGFKVIASRRNCDDDVIAEAEGYADADLSHLILVGGDGDYTRSVNALRARGIRVEVWARRANVSKELISIADSVRYIDQFLTTPKAGSSQLNRAA